MGEDFKLFDGTGVITEKEAEGTAKPAIEELRRTAAMLRRTASMWENKKGAENENAKHAASSARHLEDRANLLENPK